MTNHKSTLNNPPLKIAVIGLGHITQAAVLPAFKKLKNKAEIVALISNTPKKLKELGKLYKVKNLGNYDNLENILESSQAEAVFIGLPNSLHEEYTIRAFKAGMHVLCEKPLAQDVSSCERMIAEAQKYNLKLMTAYRLHFDPIYLSALNSLRKGEIGEPSIFTSCFSYQIKNSNIRLDQKLGGGALLDIGIYCINAARAVFASEPEAVSATLFKPDARFKNVDGTVTATLYFSNNRMAQFTASFAAYDRSWFEIVGTKGALRMEPAYEYKEPLAYSIEGRKTKKIKGKKFDQFAGEIEYFASCIRNKQEIKPNGEEGLKDLKVIEAIQRSAKSGKIEEVNFKATSTKTYPNQQQERRISGSNKKPELIQVTSASS